MLHGLWSPGSGLMLWDDALLHTDDGPPGRIEVGSSIWPSPVARVLRRKFRHRTVVHLPSPSGPTKQEVPALALAPVEAADVLLHLPPDHRGASGDLHYLAHVARGIERWARGGRVVPDVHRTDGAWWPRWVLLGGEKQRAWTAELAAAMPPSQRSEGSTKEVLTDFIGEVTDPIVRSVLGKPDSDHPFLRALLDDEPYRDGTHQFATTLLRWRDSLTVDEPELVLRLLEPEDDDSGELVEQSEDVLWTLQVCLRPDGEAPKPVVLGPGVDGNLLRIGVRKLGEAMSVYPLLSELPTAPESLDLLLPTPVVIDLVQHGASILRDKGVTLLLPRAWSRLDPSLRLKVEAPPSPVGAENRAVGMDEIVSYDWQLALGDIVLTAAEMTQLAKAKGDLVRLRGQWVQADNAMLGRAARYIEQQRARRDTSLGAVLGELTHGDPPPAPITEVTGTGWVKGLFEPGTKPVTVMSPAGLTATLRPYQQRGLDWLAFMSGIGLGAVLADDMGLGKTVQVLALLAHELSTDATLLVCPMSVVGNWQREAARFVPGLKVLVHHGPDRLRGADLTAAIAAADLVLTTYALIAKDQEILREQTWRRIVLDEAQHIKNQGTVQAKAARSIPARHKLALTGTPVENRLNELRSILDFVNPNMLGSVSTFHKRFAVPIEREHDAAATERLRSVTSPFILRRLKTDKSVISDLPEKSEFTCRTNLTAEQAALYSAVVSEMMKQIEGSEGMKRKGAVLSALTRLKQVCNHPAHFLGDGSPVMKRSNHRSGKLGFVEDTVDAILGDSEKVLLFTQFREFGDLVGPWLAERFGSDVPFLHGGVTKTRRDAMVDAFQRADGPPIMLLSLKAGGTGLNLTAANHVVHLDRWWNPAVENQATDRAFRIGQTKNVQVRKLLSVGTVEEKIDAMLTSKKDLANLAVGAGETWITEMGPDELQDMFRLGDDAVGD